MADRTPLRIRVREDIGNPAASPRIEVLAPDNTVLGDLSHSVLANDGVVWKMAGKGALSVVQITLACERGRIDTIEIPGVNSPKPTPPAAEVLGTATLKLNVDTSALEDLLQRLTGSSDERLQ